jgi:uncharacterized coiled-coil DUF342 family protein
MDRLTAFASAVQQEINTSNLDPEAGRNLLKQLNEIAEKLQNGETGKAAEKLRELDNRLAELRRDGKLSAAGFDVLNSVIASIT